MIDLTHLKIHFELNFNCYTNVITFVPVVPGQPVEDQVRGSATLEREGVLRRVAVGQPRRCRFERFLAFCDCERRRPEKTARVNYAYGGQWLWAQ